MSARTIRSFLRGERGAEAVEFALILPVLIALTVGVMEMLLLLFATASLHFAVDNAARCASIDAVACPDTTKIKAFALSHYYGPNINTLAAPALFTATTGRCGDAQTGPTGTVVTGSGAWRITGVFLKLSVPLSATACYPKMSL